MVAGVESHDVLGDLATLDRRGDAFFCGQCGHAFPVTDNIPQLFWPHETIDSSTDVTEQVKAFYEKSPFPNYDDHDSVRVLIAVKPLSMVGILVKPTMS